MEGYNCNTYLVYFSSQTEDEIEAYYRQKYGDSSAMDRFGEGEEMSDEITQQGLLPGVKYVYKYCMKTLT